MLHGRLLVYLNEVAAVGSIRGASERLGIAASSINRQIIALEEELGVPIFERMPRRLRLTAAGEALIVHIRRTLRDYDRLKSQIQDMKGLRRGAISIVTMSGLASTLMPRLSGWLGTHQPLVKLTVSVLARDQILAALPTGEADIGLGYHLDVDSSLRRLAEIALPIGVVVAPRHPLASQRQISLGDCVGQRMILPDRSTSLGRAVAAALDRVSIATDGISETNSIEFLKLAASEDGALTFMNRLDAAHEVAAGRLVFLPLPAGQIETSRLMLLQRRTGALDPGQSLVVDQLRAMMQALCDREQQNRQAEG